MKYKLFLDDERYPVDDTSVVVRSYQEACQYVENYGTPSHVDFDHDLGGGPTGYDFAKWLIERALDGRGFPLTYSVHSQNPVGKQNIIGVMENYRNPKMSLTATVETDDMEITFEAEFERGDYGVPGSPVWDEIKDVEVVDVAIWGHDVDPKTLPKGLIKEMLEQAPQDPEDYR